MKDNPPSALIRKNVFSSLVGFYSEPKHANRKAQNLCSSWALFGGVGYCVREP